MNNHLEHHGIQGQKWGVRNGPPYPLSYQAHNSREKQSNPKGSLDNYGEGHPRRKPRNYAGNVIKKVAEATSPSFRQGQKIGRAIKKGSYRVSQRMNNIASGRYGSIKGGRYSENTTVNEKDWTRDPNKGDIKLKKGQSAYRITTDKREKVKDKNMMYATVNEDDRNIFKANFQNGVFNKPKKQYEKEMLLNKDVNVASKDSQIDAIMKVTGKSREEATLLVGRMNYELVLDEMKRTPESKEFLKELKNRGYDAILDLNDSGWFGKQPVVFIDPKDYLTDSQIKRITEKDRNKAIDDMSYDYLKYTKDSVKEYLGNKTHHYTRNQLNVDLPKNDKDAAKKGWRKLSSKESAMHQFSQHDGVENSKWVSPDGHREVVFTGKGKNQRITDDVRDEGTYNYYDPQVDPFKHTIYDVLPYIVFGNESNDPTTAAGRIGESIKNFLNKPPEENSDISNSGKNAVEEIIKKKKAG